MTKSDQYRKLAAECDQIARSVSLLAAKERCRDMARSYRRLADEADLQDKNTGQERHQDAFGPAALNDAGIFTNG